MQTYNFDRMKWKSLLLILFIAAIGCKKKDNVPISTVDVYLNLQLPQFIKLNTPLNWIYYDGVGTRGIIIYRKPGNEFTIQERTCNYRLIPAHVQWIVQDHKYTYVPEW